MVSQKEITEELRGECNGCKRDMLADRIEAEGIAPEPYVDALIDILAETPFRKTLGDSKWQVTFNDQQLDIISNAIRARGQK